MPADSNLAEPAADSNPAMPAETTGGGDTEFRPAPDAEDAIPVPENYTLQAYDDCGVLGRQPHMADASSYRFPDNTVDGPPRSLSVAFSQSGPITARYEDLDATAPYIVAVTYATERGSSRVQTLHAGTHVVHGPRPIPDGRAERCTSAVPPEAIQDGTLELTFSKVDGPNPVVAEIELWAPLPSPGVVHFAPWLGYDGSIAGRVTDVRFEPVGGVGITVSANGRPVEALTADDGTFHIEEAAVAATRPKDVFQVVVVVDEHSHEFTVPAEAFIFTRPVYRSIARSVAGVETSDLLLDGTWRIVSDFSQVDEAAAGRDCVVPGQTLQQGIDVTNDSVFGLSREFDLPVDWNGQRLFIRFEAVHGEAEYFLNGMRLGRSAVVYTPIEFDITAAARPGHANRLTVRLAADAALMADHLASSTRYAHHNPVGIHRSVRVFALPPNHIARAWVDPRVRPSLDAADLRVDLMVEQAGSGVRHDGAVSLVLRDLDGHAVALSQGAFPLSLPGERNEAELRCVVDKPRL